jgi:hypothetical protein
MNKVKKKKDDDEDDDDDGVRGKENTPLIWSKLKLFTSSSHPK